jgi:hypothetical protein
VNAAPHHVSLAVPGACRPTSRTDSARNVNRPSPEALVTWDGSRLRYMPGLWPCVTCMDAQVVHHQRITCGPKLVPTRGAPVRRLKLSNVPRGGALRPRLSTTRWVAGLFHGGEIPSAIGELSDAVDNLLAAAANELDQLER